MSEHTPGPWAVGSNNSVITEAPADLRIICQPFTDGTYGPILSQEQQEANASLMAAAPDLLAAAEKVIEMNRQHAEDQYGDPEKAESWSCVVILRAAIAKATS